MQQPYLSFLIVLTCFLHPGLFLSPLSINGTVGPGNTLKLELNSSIEWIITYDRVQQANKPARVIVTSEDSYAQNPLFVVVQQEREVLSWQLPLIIEHPSGDSFYRTTARTLCYDDLNSTTPIEPPVVTVSTSSLNNVTVNVSVELDDLFRLVSNKSYEIDVSPGMSRIFYYNFPLEETLKYGNNVILVLNSNDSICMTVSIQNASCPVYDQNHDVKFEGFYETVDTKGGITIPRQKFPQGFFLVFVVNDDNNLCDSDSDSDDVGRSSDKRIVARQKHVYFSLKPSISYDKYTNAVLVTLFSIAAFYLVFGISFFLCSRRSYIPRSMEYVEQSFAVAEEVEESQRASTSAIVVDQPINQPNYNDIYGLDVLLTSTDVKSTINSGREQIYLNQLICSSLPVLKHKSYTYLWQVLTVAVFYGLPVVQLVITYQRVLQDTGNQDLCYYNFLCAHPLGLLSDFNHVFSNIGYVLLGILFLCLVRKRECWHRDQRFDERYGIPPHYGLFYAMGVALIMEGILSGSYHVCPNQSNFQFDTSFMYVIAVLCMVKIYQTRHPDVNATATATFGVLAVAILVGMVGILEANIYFWSAFTVLHLSICWYLTAQVYYMGSWSLQPIRTCQNVYSSISENCRSRQGILWLITPTYKRRFILLFLGNAINWLLASWGIYQHNKDFAIYLFIVFMSNTLLYFVFYTVMKIVYKERVNALAWTFLVLSLICAGASMYFFVNRSISWALTPAGSRHFNRECDLMQFYDNHDIWHFISAVGMFFMFVMLLLLDDDLSHTHRSKIPVF